MSNTATTRRDVLFLFATTVFVSAFLLFQVQPLISKFILPWFGGTPAVWSTCMLFFQVTLFLGYVYAHATTRFLSVGEQALLHIVLLVVASSILPITPDDSWKPAADAEPIFQIVKLLAACVGLPYFILSSTGPLLQRWFSLQAPGVSPYRLYALSNVGSLLALISYPFLVEPTIGSPTQAWLWSTAFGTFTLLCALCAIRVMKSNKHPASDEPGQEQEAEPAVAPNFTTSVRWFGLAMIASVMLLATTNQVCLDVATVPFLWIVPLTIYLLSFILCFDASRWYNRKWYSVLLVLSMMFVIRVMNNGANVPIMLQIVTYLSGLYLACMVCHGELATQKPHPKYLTRFYLLMSAGGAGGGLLVGLAAPLVFPDYLEMHFGITAAMITGIVVYFRETYVSNDGAKPIMRFQSGMLVWGFAMLWAVGTLVSDAYDSSDALDRSRNFYGVLRVVEAETKTGDAKRELFHGRIRHGSQLTGHENRTIPTTYYGRTTGSGLAMQLHKPQTNRRVGVVGMGVGTLAAYGKQGDRFRFYEINPEVIRLAKKHFSFLDDTPADCEIITGDARLSLEREEAQDFDVLVLDAFSGDAIPTHLLTREAFRLYDRHLAQDGVLCVHISNLHFDLRPIIHGLATEFDWKTLGVQNDDNDAEATSMAQWVLLSRQPISNEITTAATGRFSLKQRRLLWTDEFSNLATILR